MLGPDCELKVLFANDSRVGGSIESSIMFRRAEVIVDRMHQVGGVVVINDPNFPEAFDNFKKYPSKIAMVNSVLKVRGESQRAYFIRGRDALILLEESQLNALVDIRSIIPEHVARLKQGTQDTDLLVDFLFGWAKVVKNRTVLSTVLAPSVEVLAYELISHFIENEDGYLTRKYLASQIVRFIHHYPIDKPVEPFNSDYDTLQVQILNLRKKMNFFNLHSNGSSKFQIVNERGKGYRLQENIK